VFVVLESGSLKVLEPSGPVQALLSLYTLSVIPWFVTLNSIDSMRITHSTGHPITLLVSGTERERECFKSLYDIMQ